MYDMLSGVFCTVLFRSSETGEGNFYFTGNKVFKLYQLLVSLSMKARPGISDPKPSKSLDVPDLDDEYVYMDQSSSDEMSTRSSKTIGGRSGRSKYCPYFLMMLYLMLNPGVSQCPRKNPT